MRSPLTTADWLTWETAHDAARKAARQARDNAYTFVEALHVANLPPLSAREVRAIVGGVWAEVRGVMA